MLLYTGLYCTWHPSYEALVGITVDLPNDLGKSRITVAQMTSCGDPEHRNYSCNCFPIIL